MTESTQYIPSEVEQALYKWLSLVNPDVPVIYAQQGKIGIERPFVILQVLSDTAITEPEERVTDTPDGSGGYLVETIEHRKGVVQVTFFGSYSNDYARAAERSISQDRFTDFNRDNGIVISMSVNGISDVPQPMGTNTEPRKVCDFMFAYSDCTTDSVGAGVVEVVNAIGDVYNVSEGDGASSEIEVTWPTP